MRNERGLYRMAAASVGLILLLIAGGFFHAKDLGSIDEERERPWWRIGLMLRESEVTEEFDLALTED